MKRKRNGSALLTVILVFGILVTVGTAVMTVSLSDVKLRSNESKRVQNLYESESGLENVYGIFSKSVDEAIKEGNEKVKIEIEALNSRIVTEKDKFTNNETYNKDLIDDEGDVKEEYIKTLLNSTFKEAYKKHLINEIKGVINNKNSYLIGDDTSSPRVSIKNLTAPEVEFKKTNPDSNEPEELKMVISSSYEKIDNNGYKNLRTVETTFRIFVSEYDNPYAMENEKLILLDNIIRGKTLAINSNLELQTNSELNIKGEAYVLGRSEAFSDSTGIMINGSNAKLSLTEAKVVSKGDVRIKGDSSKIAGDDKSTLYTGSLAVENNAIKSNIDIKGSVYANNDLILNGEKSNIGIGKGFYGINDIRKNNAGERRSNSSSIIVNAKDIGEKDGSSITIGENLVLLGTAYIDTKPESYQTGESIAIKGNYKAYTAALENAGKYSKDKIIFDYLTPLQLASRFTDGKDLTLEDKNNYFMAYLKNKKDALKLSGINLPENIYTLGVAINNGNALDGNYTIDNDTIKKSVEIYENNIKEIDSINDYINYSAINSTLNKVSNFEGLKQVIYLSKENTNLEISNGNGDSKDNKIYLNGTNAKGVIIASGDVYIDGNVNFEGTIITTGKIVIKDNAKVTLNSNKKVVDYIVANNFNYFDGIFQKNMENISSNIEVDASVIVQNGLQNIPKDNLIKTSNWKLVK